MTQSNAQGVSAIAWPVVGHDRAVELLARSLAAGRVAHAYLFAGPPRVGKLTLALQLAAALLCQGAGVGGQGSADSDRGLEGRERPAAPGLRSPAPNPQALSPDSCRSCRRVAALNHPDLQVVRLLDPVEGRSRKEIAVEQIRALQRSVFLQPFEGPYKVFILDGAEALSEEAANALLKTLEEPPPYAVLALVSADPEALLPTVRSRCLRLDLRPVPTATVEQALAERWQVPPERARLLARLSGGRIGWAVAASTDEALLQTRADRLDQLMEMAASPIAERLAATARLEAQFRRDRAAVHDLLEVWLGWWRDLLLVLAGRPELVVNVDREETLRRQSREVSLEQVKGFLDRILSAGDDLQKNVNPRLVFDVLLLHLPTLRSGPA